MRYGSDTLAAPRSETGANVDNHQNQRDRWNRSHSNLSSAERGMENPDRRLVRYPSARLHSQGCQLSRADRRDRSNNASSGPRHPCRRHWLEIDHKNYSWARPLRGRSEEHTSELQSLMRISYAVCCLKKKKNK